MGKVIKVILSLIIFYLAASFIKWDFQWYLSFSTMKAELRILIGLRVLLVNSLIYCILSLIELEL